jgi:hypothetical protein
MCSARRLNSGWASRDINHSGNAAVPPTPTLDSMTTEQLRAAARGFREAAKAPVGEATAQSFIRLAKRYEDVADEREAAKM